MNNALKGIVLHIGCAIAFAARLVLVLLFIALALVAVGSTIYGLYENVNRYGLLSVVGYAAATIVGGAALLAFIAWAFWMREKCR